jgi:hypothetical protein
MYYITRMKYEVNLPHVTDSPKLPHDSQVKVSLVAKLLYTQLCKSCARVNMQYSRAECVFTFNHYFASKSLVAICEAFNTVYPDKEVPNQTVHGKRS